MGYKRPPGRCHYCGGPGQSADHIVPKSRGGSNAKWNLVPACLPCNNLKADALPICDCVRCVSAVERHWQHLRRADASVADALLAKVELLYVGRIAG